MNPSDAGGHDVFEVWGNIVLPTLGILVAVLVPLVVLYVQREIDRRSRVAAARQQALWDLVLGIAPFMNVNPMHVDMREMLTQLRIAAMRVVDTHPKGHPIGDLVAWYHQAGVLESELAMRELSKPKYQDQNVDIDEIVTALSGIGSWAASYTNDVRYAAVNGPEISVVRKQVEAVRASVEARRKRLGMPPSPDPRSWADPTPKE